MKNGTPGSVSHGTLNNEHLIQCFVSKLYNLLQDGDDPGTRQCVLDIENRCNQADEREDDDENAYYNSDEATYDLEWLQDQLDAASPEGHRFGAHEGDGSDFGWWACDDD